MFLVENDKWVLCCLHLTEENGATLLILGKALCMAWVLAGIPRGGGSCGDPELWHVEGAWRTRGGSGSCCPFPACQLVHVPLFPFSPLRSQILKVTRAGLKLSAGTFTDTEKGQEAHGTTKGERV